MCTAENHASVHRSTVSTCASNPSESRYKNAIFPHIHHLCALYTARYASSMHRLPRRGRTLVGVTKKPEIFFNSWMWPLIPGSRAAGTIAAYVSRARRARRARHARTESVSCEASSRDISRSKILVHRVGYVCLVDSDVLAFCSCRSTCVGMQTYVDVSHVDLGLIFHGTNFRPIGQAPSNLWFAGSFEEKEGGRL